MGIWDKLRLAAGRPINQTTDGPESRSLNGKSFSKDVAQISYAVRTDRDVKVSEYAKNHDDRRDKISRILKYLSEFAVDSAVNESLKGFTGRIQVDKVVKEGLKDQPPLPTSHENKKASLALVAEEMHAKMEIIQEDANNVKQQTTGSNLSAEVSDPSKYTPEELNNGSPSLRTDPKRIFIRSRL